MTALKIILAQINLTVGDFDGNFAHIRDTYETVSTRNVDLIIFPEMATCGYPPDDLLFRKRFRERCAETLNSLAALTADDNTPAMIVGTIYEEHGNLYNSAALLDGGKILHLTHKHRLPNYGVFDEKRYFTSAPLPSAFSWRGHQLGIMICEDMWTPDVTASLKQSGAELLICLNASPFEQGKHATRLEEAQKRVNESGLPLYYVNQICGQDDLVFDGNSFIMNANGEVIAQAPAWEESTLLIPANAGISISETAAMDSRLRGNDDNTLSDLYAAMVLSLREYVNKNSFPGVVLGLSGGIDSALSAAVAVDALGAERVRAIMMPSRYTSQESLDDAAECAKLMGIQLDSISIEPAVTAMDSMLSPLFTGKPTDITEENTQSRLRGNILMAISNKLGHMVLTTGNKSEMAVGYATLYGDMCGGYNVLKDTYKTEVFALSRWRNEQGYFIPERIITKPPSAELRPDQKDEDSLPPYEILDAILYHTIENELSIDAIIAKGFDRETVEKVASLLYRAEYKRYQSAPGVKVSTMAFGRNRRYPMTNKYKGR